LPQRGRLGPCGARFSRAPDTYTNERN
jgi:hypothetical protein